MTVIFLILMVLSSVCLSVIHGLGPFTHPSMIHWHLKATALPKPLTTIITIISALIIIATCGLLVAGEDVFLNKNSTIN